MTTNTPVVDGSNEGLVTVFRGDQGREVYSCAPLCKRGSGGG